MKPSRASSSAGVTTCSKLIVPCSINAVIQAWAAAGTTHRSTPGAILPPRCSRKKAALASAGHLPRPLMLWTLLSRTL